MSISAPMMSGWLIQHRSNALAPGEGATLGAGVGWPSTGAVPRTASSFWVLRLHLVRTVLGLPAWFMLTGAKANERRVLLEILAATEAMNEV